MDDFYECVIGSFDDEVEALVQYGHDCCARIDDKIHDCCERIKDAHSAEVYAYKIALGWKQEQSTLVAYDVLGNERHKALCELRKLPISYPEYSGSPFAKWYSDLSAALGIDSSELSFGEVRDKLIHLLGGDAKRPSLSDLYGMWKDDNDGMDAAGRGVCDCASADVPATGRSGDSDYRADSQGGVLTPITDELREAGNVYAGVYTGMAHVDYDKPTLDRLCDAIDAIHANLERENEELRQRTMYPAESERINMLEREVKRLAAECKTQRNNFDQATSAREHWKNLYEQSLDQIHDLEHDVEMWRDRAEDMRMERDDALNEHHAWAPEFHYMMLPKDSDGTPVHVGDVVEWCDSGDAIDVIGIGANDTLFYVDSDGDGEQAEWTTARNKRVRRADTWESIIKDAIGEGMARERCNKECCDHSGALSNADLVARCKAMVGDAE